MAHVIKYVIISHIQRPNRFVQQQQLCILDCPRDCDTLSLPAR
jgi:hypothetical protein